MSGHSHLYRHPLLLAAGYAALLVPAAVILLSPGGLADSWPTLALLAAFGLLFGLFRSGEDPRRVQLYLATQTALAAAMLAAPPEQYETHIVFNILAVQAALLLPAGWAAAWVLVFAGLSAVSIVAWWGWEYAIGALGQASGYMAFAVVGGALRRADRAHARSQGLLAELSEAHRQLQDYAAQSRALAVMQERNRLARDLHDSAKQQAFALAAQLGAARSLVRRDPAAAEARLKEAERISDSLRSELAGLILELRPPALAEKGLAAALQEYGAEWSRQAGIPLEVRVAGDCPLPAEAEQALFRIVQEALANVARHSQASRAALKLELNEGAAALSLHDDGVGFALDGAPARVGLASMRERAEALGGALTLDSAPGRGTRLEVRLKCP